MLSQLKAREMNQTDQESSSPAPKAAAQQPAAAEVAASVEEEQQQHENEDATRATCDVLCSLGSTAYAAGASNAVIYQDDSTDCSYSDKPRKGKACPKQHQLPMFLSSKFPTVESFVLLLFL
jgi:hypothetical protein